MLILNFRFQLLFWRWASMIVLQVAVKAPEVGLPAASKTQKKKKINSGSVFHLKPIRFAR